MLLKIILTLILSAIALLALSRLITGLHARPRLYAVENAPTRPVAIVFGAGLSRDGFPTPVLRDRVSAGAQLYFSGKVEKILMSGDNSTLSYNEPGAMREFALSLGVPAEDIVLDYAGRRTYDTCYRARDIFGLKEVILVTQDFHLPRALYTCNVLGVDAVGVSADQREYHRRSLFYWNAREIGATFFALLDLHLTHPLPILGQAEPIFPETIK